MKTFKIGSTLVLEFTLTKKPPFKTQEVLFDPTSLTLKIYDPDGVEKLNTTNLQRSSTGKFYYTLQTDDSFKEGVYRVVLEIQDGQFSDLFEDITGFELIG